MRRSPNIDVGKLEYRWYDRLLNAQLLGSFKYKGTISEFSVFAVDVVDGAVLEFWCLSIDRRTHGVIAFLNCLAIIDGVWSVEE